MEVPPFKHKIQKQHEVVLKEFTKFRYSWQGKSLPNDKIQTYCNLVLYLSNLNSTYVHNCAQYFTPSMKLQTLSMNKTIIEDMIKKIKQFQAPITVEDPTFKAFNKEPKETCYVCASKIRQVDIKLIKQQLVEDASLRMSLLKKIYSDLQNQHALLFSKDQDQVFFKFLNRILLKKQQVLAMQTRQIGDFLKEVTKSFSDLNLLAEYTPSRFGSAEYKQNYQQEMEKMILQTLKSGFNGKVHPWVRKVFESMRKHITSESKKVTYDGQAQTQEQMVDIKKQRSEYAASNQNRKELEFLKEEVQRHMALIENLKTQISVLTKQKKQLEAYYTKEMNELQQCKKSIEQELKKTQSDFFNLKTLKDTQISELNKKLANQRKKTEPNPPTSKRSDSSQIIDKQKMLNETQQLDQDSDAQTFKKKKSHLNKLFSNRPDMNRGHFSNKYKSTTQLTHLNSTTQFKNGNNSPNNQAELEANASENPNRTLPVNSIFSNANNNEVKDSENSIKIADEFLKEIKLRKNKRNSKNTEGSFSIKQQKTQPKQQLKRDSKHQSKHESNHQLKCQSKVDYTPKVQFKLDPLIGCREDISVIVEENQNQKGLGGLEVTGSAPKMSKRKFSSKKVRPEKSQKKSKRQNKRNLSIQMKIPPILKAGQSIYKPRNSQVKFSQTSHMTSSSGFLTKGAIGSSKQKVFKYVPLENQREYEQLKQKMNEVTSRIEAKNCQKLKQSIRYTKDKDDFSNSDISKIHGFSVFSKKFTKTSNEKDNSFERKGKSRTRMMNKSKESDSQSNGDLNIGIAIQSKSTRSKLKSKSKMKSHTCLSTSRKAKVEQKDFCMQTESATFSINRQLKHFSLIDEVPIQERKKLFEKLAKQSVINPNLSFHHYEMIVRKMFADHKSDSNSQSNPKLVKSRVSSLNPNEDKKDKQKSSVKINIDSKFFEGADLTKNQLTGRGPHHHSSLNRGKLLLNLPKLNHSSSLMVSGVQSKNSLNSTIINQHLFEVPKTKNSPFNTLRETRNQFKNEASVNGRQNDLNSEGVSQLNQYFLEQAIKEEEAEINDNRHSGNEGDSLPIPSPRNQKNAHPESNNNKSPGKCISASRTIRNNSSTSGVLQPINPKRSQVFGTNDIKLLFESELVAFEYEQLIKAQSNPHFNQNGSSSTKAYILTKEDLQSIKSLHQVLNQIKQKNSEIYYKVCSFVKSPYQAVRGGFDFINTAKDLSLESWTQYLSKIYNMKRGDNTKGSTPNSYNKENSGNGYKGNMSTQNESSINNGFNGFLRPFEQKLVELLIMAQKS